MRIMHLSDTHGRFREPKGVFDIVVHSGDLLPDPPFNPIPDKTKADAQFWWVEKSIPDFKLYFGRKPFLFSLGNHDWIDPFMLETLLRDNGIDAYCLHDKIIEIDNVRFYGFPYVPPINGRYAYETVTADMVQRIDEMVAQINFTYTDVIVAHCPPAGCLDLAFDQMKRFGNGPMATALDFKIEQEMMPSLYLTGHIHASHGITNRNGLTVSNAATVQHILEI